MLENTLKRVFNGRQVLDMPVLLRFFLVKAFVISPFSLHPNRLQVYKTIWTDRGSPLKVITDDFAATGCSKSQLSSGDVAMRYGNPTTSGCFKKEVLAEAPEIKEIMLAQPCTHISP